MDGVIVDLPIPESAAAAANFTAGGAASAVGTVTGYVVVLVGTLPLFLTIVTPVIVSASAASALPSAFLNVVPAIVSRQPAPEPVASVTVEAPRLPETIRSFPSSVVVMLTVGALLSVRGPACTPPVVVTLPATASPTVPMRM